MAVNSSDDMLDEDMSIEFNSDDENFTLDEYAPIVNNELIEPISKRPPVDFTNDASIMNMSTLQIDDTAQIPETTAKIMKDDFSPVRMTETPPSFNEKSSSGSRLLQKRVINKATENSPDKPSEISTTPRTPLTPIKFDIPSEHIDFGSSIQNSSPQQDSSVKSDLSFPSFGPISDKPAPPPANLLSRSAINLNISTDKPPLPPPLPQSNLLSKSVNVFKENSDIAPPTAASPKLVFPPLKSPPEQQKILPSIPEETSTQMASPSQFSQSQPINKVRFTPPVETPKPAAVIERPKISFLPKVNDVEPQQLSSNLPIQPQFNFPSQQESTNNSIVSNIPLSASPIPEPMNNKITQSVEVVQPSLSFSQQPIPFQTPQAFQKSPLLQVEQNFSISMDRSFADFKRSFNNQLTNAFRTQSKSGAALQFDVDTFCDSISVEIDELIDLTIPSLESSFPNISKQVCTSIENFTKPYQQDLSSVTSRRIAATDKQVAELKKLQEELDSLRSTYKACTDTILQEFEQERDQIALVKEGEEKMMKQCERMVHELRLKSVKFESKSNHQKIEKTNIEKSLMDLQQKIKHWNQSLSTRSFDENSEGKERLIHEINNLRTEISRADMEPLFQSLNDGLKEIKNEEEMITNDLLELEVHNRTLLTKINSIAQPLSTNRRSPQKRTITANRAKEQLNEIRRRREVTENE